MSILEISLESYTCWDRWEHDIGPMSFRSYGTTLTQEVVKYVGARVDVQYYLVQSPY